MQTFLHKMLSANVKQSLLCHVSEIIQKSNACLPSATVVAQNSMSVRHWSAFLSAPCQRTTTGVWKGLKKGWVCCIWETSFQRLSTRDAHQHLFIFLPDTLCTPCQTTDRDGLGSLSKEKQETPADTWVTRDSAVIPYNAVARKNRLFGFAYLLRVQRPHTLHVHVLLSLLKKTN